MDPQPRPNQIIYNYASKSKVLGKAINNYQKIFGVEAGVYRIEKRELDKLVKVYGASNVTIKDRDKFKFLKSIKILNNPVDFAVAYHRNLDEIEIKLGSDEKLLVGDLIRIPYMDNIVLDYFISELPKTVVGSYYSYQATSNFNIIQL